MECADVSGVDRANIKRLRLKNALCARGVFTLAFVYSLAAGLIIQLVILPFLLPGLDAGHGLLKGGDWVGFHQEAIRMAERIHLDGWAVWELRPQGNAPIGISAAAYALTGISEPWVLMPLNAGLFAVGATCLYTMFSLFAPPRFAFVATLPYVLFPSAAVIYGQIHKDVWSIAGVTLIALVWVRIAAHRKLDWKETGFQALLTLTGGLFVWLVRPYMLQVLLVASFLTAIAVALERIAGPDKSKFSVHGFLRSVLPLVILIFFLNAPSGTSVQPMDILQGEKMQTPEAVLSKEKELITTEMGTVLSKEKSLAAWQLILQRARLIAASTEDILSKFVSKLAADRQGFTKGYPGAGSNIDTEDDFHSVGDVWRYMPRALQIALFAPFPSMWQEAGTSPGADQMRLISGMEMTFTYFWLPGIILLFLCVGIRGQNVAILIQAIVPAVILTLVVSNIGTLYRMRYINLQMLNGLGIIGWMMWIQYCHTKYRKVRD